MGLLSVGSAGNLDAETLGASNPPILRQPIVLRHDLGPVLATGQELRHGFTLENRTDRAVRLVRPTAYTPCCSTIGPVPESIPPGGSVEVPVVVGTQGRKGRGRLNFSVESARPDGPIWHLVLESHLVPEWDVEPVGDRVSELHVGASAEQRFRLICRRRGDDGLPLPAIVRASGPLEAVFEGPAEESTDPDGLITASRLIHVVHDVVSEPGPVSGLLSFRWPDLDLPPRELELRWRIMPGLSVSPSALILRGDPGPTTRSVLVRSLGQPFRVLEVIGPLNEPVAPSTEAKAVQVVNLAIDPARLAADGAADILIRTDHPEQPDVTLTVLLLDQSQGAER